MSSCTHRTKGHEIIRDGRTAAAWLGCLPGRGRKSQCVSLACRSLNATVRGIGSHCTRLHHDTKMWQWGNSVTACCVMLLWFLTYCDERKKMTSNGFSAWWKGAPADRASVSLFLKAEWQRIRRKEGDYYACCRIIPIIKVFICHNLYGHRVDDTHHCVN